MASRANRKRDARKAAEARRWFEEGAFDDERPRPRDLAITFDFGPLVETSRKVREAFASLAAKMRELALAAKQVARVQRPRSAHPKSAEPQQFRCPARRRSGAFRLPRGGGRWSARS